MTLSFLSSPHTRRICSADRQLLCIRWSFLISLLIANLFLAVTQTSAQTGQITPVHDPCVIKSGDYWYVFSTGDRLVIRRSPDLYRWEFVGSVFGDIPAWGVQEVPGVSNIWAPDIFYKSGTYYLFYSLSTFGSNRSRIGMATNVTLDPNDSDYEWVDQGKVFESNSPDNFNAIDPNIFRDSDGSIWMSLGSFWSGIKMIELDTTSLRVKAGSTIKSIASRGGGAIEAPFLISRNGYYYLFVSFDACCRGIESTYKIRVGRSQNVTGPYVDRSGRAMLSSGGTLVFAGDDRWKGTGHCAVLPDGDRDWLVYHAYDAQNNGIPTLRTSFLDWDEEGWPFVDNNVPVNVETPDSRPEVFSLSQNYPNPFNPGTTINFQVAELGQVKIKIFDIRGREVLSLVNKSYEPGSYSVQWDGTDHYGRQVTSGLYLCEMQLLGRAETKKMLLVR